ncbi:serine/threonine-protein kinase [Kitasatospora sp. NPDC049258]|uniref:serine/threonine-protein kinase n=1 Tax=Kitasatospora sp. NPDC049258 TaxID=3155394 RepID=UPI003436337D
MTRGRVIDGRYRLTDKIGHGGMGQVWAGDDRRLEREVAVKLLRTDQLAAAEGSGSGPRDELRRRFLRECRTTAALDHPGLVAVFDAGEDQGELYLVMQRVPGLSLADLLAEEGPLPVDRAAAVAAQICGALGAVHAVPVVHRDLKPSNVMVRQDGRVILLDLGIATALDPTATRLTLTGTPIGSPAYMAPEQALAAGADPRSDLYALGCLLHEMLCGQTPFPAPTALGVLRRHVDDPPVPLRELRPDVPAGLEALVLDLLAKRPDDRPADVRQVVLRLLPLLPGPAAGPQPGYGPLPDPTRPYRHPHQPQPGTAAAPAPVPAPARVLMAAVPAPVPERTPAPAPTPTPPPAAGPAELTAACARLSDLVAARRHAEVLDLAAGLLPRARAELGEAAPLVHTIRAIYARTLLAAGRPGEALPEYRLLAAAGQPYDGAVLDHRYRAALCLEQLGRSGQALAEYQELLAAHAGQPGGDPDRGFELRERIGLCRAAAGDHEGAWQALLELLLDRERRHGPHHPDVLRLRRHLEGLRAHRSTGAAAPPPRPPYRADPRGTGHPTPPPVPGNPYATGG